MADVIPSIDVAPVKGVDTALQDLQRLLKGVQSFENAIDNLSKANKGSLEEAVKGMSGNMGGAATAVERAMVNLINIIKNNGQGAVNGVRDVDKQLQAAYEKKLFSLGRLTDEELRIWQSLGVRLGGLQKAQLKGVSLVDLLPDGTQLQSRVAELKLLVDKAGADLTRLYDSLPQFAKRSAGNKAVREQIIDVKSIKTQLESEIAQLETTLKSGAVKLATAQEQFTNSSFAMGANTISTHTAQAKRAIAGHYNSLGLFVAEQQAKAIPVMMGPTRATFEAAMLGTSSSISGPLKGQQLGVEATSKLNAELNRLNTEVAKSVTNTQARINPIHPDAVKATNGLSGALGGLGRQFTDVHSMARGLASGFNLLWLTWGSMTPLLAGAAISMSFTKAIKEGREVGESMADIQHLAGATTEEVNMLSTAITKLAETGAYAPTQTAKALQVLSLAGLDAKEALTALKPTLDFATTGGMAIEKSAESLIAVSTAYGYGAAGMSTVADVIAKTAAMSMASVDAMTESFKVASVVAQQFGVTLEDSALNLAFLSQIGIKGTAAGTAMTNFYNQIISGSGPARKALKDLGVQGLDEVTNSAKPLIRIIGELDVALSKKKGTAQQEYIQAITSNRGSKDLAAALVAYRVKLDELDPAMTKQIAQLRLQGEEQRANQLETERSITTFKKYQDQLKDSAGFSALAAASKAYTPDKLIAGMGSSLSSSLLGAFKDSEDSLTNIAIAIKAAFSSPEFKSGISSMVAGVTSFVGYLQESFTWLVKNKDVIAEVAVEAAKFATILAAGFIAGKAVVALEALRMAYLGVAAAATLSGGSILTLTNIFGAANAAAIKASLAFMATPVGMIATAAAAITAGAAYLLLRDNTSEAEKATKRMQEADAEKLKADQGRSAIFADSIAKAIQNYDDLAEARKTGLAISEIVANREAELAFKTIEATRKAADAKIDILEQEAIAKTMAYRVGSEDDNSYEISSIREQFAAVRADNKRLADLESASLEYQIQQLKTKASIQAEIDRKKAASNRPPVGDEGGPAKADKSGAAAKYEAIVKSMEAFEAGTADMAKSLTKLTEAEKFENTQMAALQSLYDSGIIKLDKYAEAAARVAIAKASRDSQVELNAANDLAKATDDLSAKLAHQLVVQHEQTETEALLAKVTKELSTATETQARATLELTKARLTSNLATEQAIKNQKELKTLEKDAAKTIADIDATVSAMESVSKAESEMEAARAEALRRGPEYVAKLEAETKAREKNAKAIASTAEQIEKLEDKIWDTLASGGTADFAGLDALIARLEKLKNATEAAAGAAGQAAFQKAVSIDRDRLAGDLADAVITGLTEGGEKGARNIRDVLTREFLTKPIQVWIKATISEILGGTGSSGGSGSTAESVTGIGAIDSILGSANKIAGLYLGSGMGNFAMSSVGRTLGLSTVSPDFVGPTAAGAGNTLTTAGELFRNLPIGGMITAYTKGGVGGFVQGAAGIAGAGAVTGAMATGTVAGTLGGATSALAAVPGYGWAAMAALAILGMNKNKEYVKSLGESNVKYDARGSFTGKTDAVDGVSNAETDKFANGVAAAYYDTAKSLGITAKAIEVGYGANNSDGGKYRLGINMGGKNIYDSGETKTSEEAVKLSATQAVLTALKGSELPKALEGMFDGVDIAALTQVQADTLMEDAKGFKAIADAANALPFNSLTDASHETLVALTAASGGLDKLTANLTTYYARFYTEAERTAKNTDKVTEEFKRLGIDVIPKTKEEFRALVEKIGTATPEAAKLTAELYAISGAFADSTEAADAQLAAMTSLNASLAGVGAQMFSLDTAGYAAANGLAAAAGGLANLQGLISSFSQGYFTEAEQRVNTVRSVTADLNAAGFSFTEDQVGSASRSDIRSAVQTAGQDISSPEGQKRYVAALKAAQALDGTLPKLAKAVESASGGGSGGGAVNSIKDAWATIVDSLWGEVKRIKGLIEETGPTAYVAAQARFAMTTAAARAGDQEAAKALPGVSQSLLKLAESNETTLVALKLMQGSVATSLIQTATQLSNEHGLSIPQFAVGTNYVPKDMLAMIHEGEAIIPKAYNPANSGGSDNAELIAEIRALRGQVRVLELRLGSIDETSTNQAKMFKTVTEDGKAMRTEAY